MLSDLSARFINVINDQVDMEIEHALKEILEFFHFDRCTRLGFAPEQKKVRVTHAAYGSGIEHVSGDLDLANLFPWCYERLAKGHTISISRAEEMPEEANLDKRSLAATGTAVLSKHSAAHRRKDF